MKLIGICNLYEVIENHKREILKKNCLIKKNVQGGSIKDLSPKM